MSFSKQVIDLVWEKAEVINGSDSRVKRKDKCGAWIARSAYGDHNSDFGWDVDHVIPESNNGGNHISNLQPLHWENNNSKSDGPDRPTQYCVVKARN